MQMEGSKITYDIELDVFIKILEERQFSALDANRFSENWKLIKRMKREAEITKFTSKNENDVGYNI